MTESKATYKDNDVPVYNCPRINMPPTIDGRLDDEAWRLAPPVNLVLSATGNPATKDTVARMCWDKDNLYIAFDCVDEDVWATMTGHDEPLFKEEVVEAFLDPGCTVTRHFEFVINPRNAVFDAEIHQQVGSMAIDIHAEWDCAGLETAVVVEGTLDDRTDIDKGWTAEIKIPFASMGLKTPESGEVWRGNLYRIDLTPEPVEFQSWSPTMINPPSFHVPPMFGKIVFVGGND